MCCCSAAIRSYELQLGSVSGSVFYRATVEDVNTDYFPTDITGDVTVSEGQDS